MGGSGWCPIPVPWRRAAEQPPVPPPAQLNLVDSAPEGPAQLGSMPDRPVKPELGVSTREGPAQPKVRAWEGSALAKSGVCAPVGPASLPPKVSTLCGTVQQLPVKPSVSLGSYPRLMEAWKHSQSVQLCSQVQNMLNFILSWAWICCLPVEQ